MAIQFYARCDYKYSGDTKFSIPFEYMDKSHVVVIINDDEDNPSQNFTFLTDYQIDVKDELEIGDIVSVRRTTPLDERFVVFTDGNILDEETQNISALQVFDKMQEVTDAQNNLQTKMTEFLNLKTLIEETLNTLKAAYDAADIAQDLLQQTTDLVQDISTDYNNLKEESKKGIKCSVAKNLFSIEMTDKVLSGTEKEGLGGQGEEISADNYETAYNTLVEEYNNGTSQVYTSTDEVTYYKSYTGSVSGNFYLPSDKNLEVSETVYADTYCQTSKGTVTQIEDVSVNKYEGETNTFYINKDVTLAVNISVYSDAALQSFLGLVTNLKTVKAAKYKGSKTGNFYVDTDSTFRVGRKIFKDEELSEQLGYITAITNFEADEYSVGGLDNYDKFYVPKGTTLAKDTVIYSDKYCTQSIGTISAVGSASSSAASYYYKFKYGVSGKSVYFYSKTKFSKGKSADIYKDSACTKPYYYSGKIKAFFAALTNSNGAIGSKANNSYTYGDMGTYKLQNTISSSSYAYITLTGSTTKLSYNKIATISSEVISINDAENEYYEFVEQVENSYIKIGEGEYQKYSLMASLENIVIVLDSGVAETVINNGVLAHSGMAFEYKLASNGHKIVDIQYKTAVGNLTSYYLLDMTNKKFTLPKLDTSKNIYFVVGNIVVSPASIQGVTKDYLDERLEDYAKVNNETLVGLMAVLQSYQTDIQGLNEALEKILGE